MATSVTFDLFARDHASGAFVKVGQAAQKTAGQVEKADRKTRDLSGSMDVVSRVGPRALGIVATGAKAVALGVGAIAVAGAAAFTGFIKEAQESAKISRITENAIRATGGAAKISADQVGSLAMAISNKTGVDDEAIQSGANLLLTFKKVRNEVGAGNQIFNRATQAATDLSAAGFGDLNGASKMLGKALNDPLKGLTALGRAGVTFTQQQKDQIAALVKTGNVLGAQRIILKEVESQVGGAAAAAADPMQKLRVIVGNLAERLGGFLLPVIGKIATWLGTALPHALDIAVIGFKALVRTFQEGDITSDGFVGAMERIGLAARLAFDFFQTSVLPRIKTFGSFLRDDAVPALATFGGWLAKNRAWLIPIAAGIGAIIVAVKVWTVVSKAFAVVQGIVNAVLMANPIGLVVLAIAGLVAAFVVAYRTSDTFRAIVQKAWAGIQVAASFAWNNVLKPVFSALNTFVRSVLAPTVLWLWQNVFGPAFRGIAAVVQVVWPIVRGIFQTWWAFIRNVLAPVFMWVWRNVVTPAFNGIRDKIATVWAVVRPILTTVGNFIRDKVAPAFSAGVTAIGRAWDRIKAIATTPVNFIIGTVLNRGIFAAYNWIVSKFGGTRIPDLPLVGQGGGGSRTSAGGRGRAFAEGGQVRGPGSGRSDSIAAWLSNGEHVWTADEVKKAGGHRAVEQMRQRVAQYADGGAVGAGIKAGLSSAFGIVSGNKVINPITYLRGKITGALSGIGGSDFARMLATIPRRIGALLVDKVRQLFSGGGPMGAGGVMGYQNQMAVLRRAFPGLALISGFRPGAITATGNRSYHAMGRAVDVPPRMDVFNWIRANYGARTKELIFSPAGNNQVWNGRPHWYSEPTRGDHWDHVHWAMAGGGVIREPVLGVGRSGATYSFGERGPETVTPGVGGREIHVHIHGAVGADQRTVSGWVRQGIREALKAEGKAATAAML